VDYQKEPVAATAMNASGFPLKQQTASVLPARRHPVTVRRLAAHDSLVELTALLHDAFSRLKDMGLNCTCVDQSVDTTRQAVGKGECYVAECNGHLVGTVTLCGPDAGSRSELYRQGDVASVRQLGIAPDSQSIGLGSALLDLARSWARARDYRCVALETPKPAQHLLDFYAARGVRAIEAIRFPGRCYVSAVMCKDLGSPDTAMTQSRLPGVHLSPLVGAGAAWTFAAIQGAVIERHRPVAFTRRHLP
jgi:GNAT superfamily N-acetyltransferase